MKNLSEILEAKKFIRNINIYDATELLKSYKKILIQNLRLEQVIRDQKKYLLLI
jgi:hypothetical protein